jgi:hypothetical protein
MNHRQKNFRRPNPEKQPFLEGFSSRNLSVSAERNQKHRSFFPKLFLGILIATVSGFIPKLALADTLDVKTTEPESVEKVEALPAIAEVPVEASPAVAPQEGSLVEGVSPAKDHSVAPAIPTAIAPEPTTPIAQEAPVESSSVIAETAPAAEQESIAATPAAPTSTQPTPIDLPEKSDLGQAKDLEIPAESVAQLPMQDGLMAQGTKSDFLVPVPETVISTGDRFEQVITGTTLSTPTAFGAQWEDLFVVAGLQHRTRVANDPDGGIGFGAGFGNPFKNIGAEIVLNSFSTVNGTPFSSGGMSFKLHRRLPHLFAIAVGLENAIKFGDTDSPRSPYGVVSKIIPLRKDPTKTLSFLTLSVGVGSGRFGHVEDLGFRPKAIDDNSINVFGSAALQIARPIAFIANWTGQDLNLGFAIAPLKNKAFIITPAVADVTGNAGSPPRFLLTVGYGFRH